MHKSSGSGRTGRLAAVGAAAVAGSVLALLAAAPAPLAQQGQQQEAPQGEPIQIGVMGPFTGPASRTGEVIKRSAEMALEDARAAGEVPVTIDGQKHDVELVWVDSQSSPEKAVKAVTDAISRQGVDIMAGGWHSSVAMAVMDAEAPHDIVHIGHGGESQYISEKLNQDPEKYKGWFKGWPAPPIFAALYGEPLRYFEEQGLWTPRNNTAAVLVEDTDFGRGWGEALQASLESTGFDPMAYDVTALDETEFTPLLTKYKAMNVPVVGMTTTGSVSASNFVKQFRNMQVPALLLGHGLTWFGEWPELTGDASDYVLTMDSPRVILPEQQEWVERYQDKYGEEPSLAPAGIGYDYTRLTIDALNEAGTLDFDQLVDTVRNIDHKGVWHRYQFSKEPSDRALAPNEVMTGGFMEGFFFPMVQLMDGEAKIIWPLEHAEAEFQRPPWIPAE